MLLQVCSYYPLRNVLNRVIANFVYFKLVTIFRLLLYKDIVVSWTAINYLFDIILFLKYRHEIVLNKYVINYSCHYNKPNNCYYLPAKKMSGRVIVTSDKHSSKQK